MVRDMLKRISTRIFYIIFAILVSIALWLYVEITENEIQSREIRNVEIILKNQDLLNNRGLLVSLITPESLTLTFEGPLSEISKLATTGAVTAEVDLETIRSAGTYNLLYDEILPESVNAGAVTVSVRSVSRITLNIDRMLDRQFPVEVNYTGGTSSDDLIAERPEYDPQFVTVSGPEEIISRIAHVHVPIIWDNLSATYTDELGVVLVDEFGEQLSSEYYESGLLTVNPSTIQVTIPIKQQKTVPLIVEPSHMESTTSLTTVVHVDPSFVTVSGEPEIIRNLNFITLGTIDMTSFALTTTRVFPIIMPNQISNISGELEAMVVVEVLNLSTKFTSVTNIQTVNVPLGYSAEILTQSLDVRLRGTTAALAAVDSSNIMIVADLTDISTGTSRVTARAVIYGTDAVVDTIGEYSIVVTITEDNGE